MSQPTSNCVLVDAHGRVPTYPHQRDAVMLLPVQPDAPAYQCAPGLFVQRVATEETARSIASTWNRVSDPQVVQAIGYLEYRERTHFHPSSGEALTFPQTPRAVGHTAQQLEVFPRIDPAVIGRITLEGTNKLLVARNALRPDYFSLIAGFVEIGETIEQAFAREALEETGTVVENIKYVQSQPWPYGGSLMIGVEATTADEQPKVLTDNELVEIRWISPAEVFDDSIPLPHQSSIAHAMITTWARAHLDSTHLDSNAKENEGSKQ